MRRQETRHRKLRRPAADASPPRDGAPPRRAPPPEARGQGWLYGRHPVAAALANPARRWRRLAFLAGNEAEAAALLAAARAEWRGSGEPTMVLEREALARLLPDGAVHQGWALEAEALDEPDLDDVLRAVAVAREKAIVIVLDRVSDPHNVGAVLRSAAAFGAAAVILPAHGTPGASGAIAKAAAGGLDQVKLLHVGNVAQALDRLKAAGFWCVGLDERAPTALAALDPGDRVVLVLGSEGAGLRRLVRERCDYLARLPTRPQMPSLNVSNAAAAALYELRRGEDAGPV